MTNSISREEVPYIGAAMAINGIGRRTFWRIQNYLTKYELTWGDFWVGNDDLYRNILLKENIVKSIKNLRNEYDIISFYNSLKRDDVRVISYSNKAYPYLLKQIVDPPPLLFVKSKQPNLQRVFNDATQLTIAVVGSRNMTSYGEYVTQKVVGELAAMSTTVVSGFMYGVDMTAHKVALKNATHTIAILGYGFDHMYPRSFAQFVEPMLEQGCTFVTEYLPQVEPRKAHFIQRNQIIAGMSHGVLVTQAAEKSGSHITAQFALDEGRAVFAIPGPISDPYSQGTKWLLNQGATLVEAGDEIVSELAGTRFSKFQANLMSSTDGDVVRKNDLKSAIYAMLATQPLSAEQVHQQLTQEKDEDEPAPASWAEISEALSLLELNGSIMRRGLYYAVLQ